MLSKCENYLTALQINKVKIFTPMFAANRFKTSCSYLRDSVGRIRWHSGNTETECLGGIEIDAVYKKERVQHEDSITVHLSLHERTYRNQRNALRSTPHLPMKES